MAGGGHPFRSGTEKTYIYPNLRGKGGSFKAFKMTTMTTELEKVEREGEGGEGTEDEYRNPTPLRVPANGC